MAFLRSVNSSETAYALHGRGVYLRAPQMTDFAEWTELRACSRAFLTPWEPTWPVDDLTRAAFRRRIKRYSRDMRDDTAYPFFVFDGNEERLLGGVTLSHVCRGVTQSCALGYWIGEPFARRGHMTAAVRTILPFVFDQLRLHRVEAACLPTNTASIKLLENVGFVREGFARRYLRINGSWQDHILFAILKDDPRH